MGFWPDATCGTDVASIVRAIQHVVQVAGIDHVSYGSDWDGAVSVPVDAAHLIYLTDALVEAGFSPADIGKIAGGNMQRVFLNVLH